MRRVTRIGLAGLAVIVLGYAGVCATLFLLQRRILFRPDVARPDVAAVGVAGLQAITLSTGSGLALLAWWLPAPPGRATVLYLHGNGGNLGDRSDRINRLATSGLGVLMPEYPGYGGNPGAPSEQSLFETGAAAFDFLERRGVAGASIVVYGESLGTGVASWLAAGRPVGALVLESPFTSVTALARLGYGFLPVDWLVRDRFDTLDRIGRVRAPLLVALGSRDAVVPPAMGRAVFRAAPGPKQLWIAEEGGHEDLARFGLLDVVRHFIDQSIR